MSESIQIFLQLLLSGLSVGGVYAMVALGFVLIYKATGVFNFAQGELMMVGAYFSFYLITEYHLHFLQAFLLALVLSAFLGMVLEFLILRPMVGEPIFSVVMITVGLAVVLKGTVSLVWGHDVHRFPSPFASNPLSLAGVAIFPSSLWTIVATCALVVIFILFFRISKVGIAMRAVANDQRAAQIIGISIRKIFSISWAIAAVVATIGGFFFVNIFFVTPDISQIGMKAFPAAILGGMDSVPGAIIGGLIIGIVENLAGGYLDKLLGGGIKEISSFVVLILILMIKPYGLFGKKEVTRV